MAIIPLRTYNREIEGMIDNGQLDEAVAHCRHILATFPKHIASYRLLGKAHLEQQRISDATDIFQRVLTAIPDDFISNVGMSIIREDENNLDAAIWHMELAYEAQPANIAIQDELRRLYGRRDGMQPPKVRLTRGALARMYSKGGLYDQAIAELRAAITEDPNRLDLQLLLAQMFFQTSQRVDAVETCVNILKKIPLCLEANRILAVSLPEAEGSDAVKNYRQIVISMDPYYAFAEMDAISSEQVPENAVNIERLEWKSGIQIGETPSQPNWATSLGISMEKPADENIPDWLKSAEAPPPGTPVEKGASSVSPFIWDTQEVEKIITDTSKPEGDIPDWMKDAGWKTSTGEASAPTDGTKSEQSSASVPSGEDVEKAGIPDWLSGIAPEGGIGAEKPGVEPKTDDLSNPWLEPHQPGPTDSIIQWLDEKKGGTAATPSGKEENFSMDSSEEIPDWLKDIDISKSTPAADDKSSGSTPAFSFEPSASTEDAGISKSAGTEDSILSNLTESAAEIQPLVEQPIIPPEVSAAKEATGVFSDEIPDWLKEIAEELPAAGAFVGEGGEPSTETPEITVAQPAPEQPIALEEVPVSPGETLTEALSETSESLQEVEPTPLSAELATALDELSSEEAPTAELPVVEESPLEAEIAADAQAYATSEIEPTHEAIPSAELPSIEQSLPEPEISAVSDELSTPEVESTLAEVSSAELPVMEEAHPEAEVTAESTELPTAEFEPTSTVEPSIEQPPVEEVPPQDQIELSSRLPDVEQPVGIDLLQSVEASFVSNELPSLESPAIEAEEPLAEQPTSLAGNIAPAEPTPTADTDAFAWLDDLVAEQAAKDEDLSMPVSEGEVTPPDWVKLESEPSPLDGVTLESEIEKDISALPADEVPDWIKGLGEEPDIEPSPEALVSLVPPEAEIPAADELPAWLLEMKPPEPPKEGPASPEAPLEWKSEELPEWLKEITESVDAEGIVPLVEIPPVEIAYPAVEAPLAEQIPAGLAEGKTDQIEEIIPLADTVAEAKEGPAQETGAWIPEVETTMQPIQETPSETEPELIPSMDQLATKVEEITPTLVSESVQQPLEVGSEAEIEALTYARESIIQGKPSQAVAFYSELIKQNYHLDEVIKDLQDALYRFPVDVNMWVILGDAHFRSDELQEALNAYTKAEELVR